MAKDKNKKEESLTLDVLARYNQEVLFPYFKETFAGKKEFTDFKNENLNGQDKILKKLDILIQEKDVRDYQSAQTRETAKGTETRFRAE